MTLLIVSKQDVEKLLDMKELISEIKNAYISYSLNKSVQLKRAVALIDESSIVVNFPGCVGEDEYYTIKVNVKNPGNLQQGLPFLQGTITLIERQTGRPIALFESSLITAMRTGAAGAVGVEALALPDANTVALIGAGVQGEWQLRALHAIGRLNYVNIYDTDQSKAENLANLFEREFNITAKVSNSIEDAIKGVHILITTTPSREPIIRMSMLKEGLHINAFGADQPGKVELSSSVINSSHVIVDDMTLSLSDGALNVTHETHNLGARSFPEIGDILAGTYAGRTSATQMTVFANVGLAFQDAVACKMIYRKAINQGLGTRVRLG